ncbi:SpoIIE family protein phosphatase [Streptomyces sp. RB6PN25]|uniref:SpoIIE family protein phosphatase n=1 Tax=Streptomyces humicola TaxID=2953240 RepID=A0ABT1Q2F5_9ACTN|nr:SpoIIE family protein phosphatase [Streptomyces humicola]MCQ4084111.1 SpoIIE family protein phosphatase [Streptomyces humicola]
MDEAIVEALFTRGTVGLFVFDPDLRLVRINAAAHRMLGVSDESLGLRLGEAVHGIDSAGLERMLRQVLNSGDPSLDVEQPGFPPSDPGREHVISVSAYPMYDHEGHPLGVVASVRDVTDSSRARVRSDLLRQADARIGTVLDVTRTAEQLAEVAVPALADTVVVDVLDAVIHGELPAPGPRAGTALLRRVAYQSVRDTAAQASPAVGEPVTYPFPTPHTQTLSDLRPRLVRDLAKGDGDWLETGTSQLIEAGAHSLMLIPLSARGAALGLVCFSRSQRPSSFDEDDLTLAAEIASRAALSIDNARRYTREHSTASVLQRSLLPSRLPEHPAVEAAHCYLPGAVNGVSGAGGDWFDVIPLSGARVALVVGDVVGRGLYAAASMGRLRAAIRAMAALDLPPDELLAHLDELVIRLADEPPDPFDERASAEQPLAATCVYMVYNPITLRCTMARAGHPPPVLISPDGTPDILDAAPGPPLGVGGLPFEMTELSVSEGSLLALYTNGLLSAHPGEADEALDQLCRVLAEPGRPAQDVCDAAVYALLPTPPKDDAVILAARTRALGPDRVATSTLPADAASVSTARTLVRQQLHAWGLEALVFSTELIASELVTNAIRYASGPVQLRLILNRTLICEVSDGSSSAPHLRHPRTSDEGGRGLFLVAQLAQHWGVRYTRQGKTVWAEQALPAHNSHTLP